MKRIERIIRLNKIKNVLEECQKQTVNSHDAIIEQMFFERDLKILSLKKINRLDLFF
jgi:hypothetical protein